MTSYGWFGAYNAVYEGISALLGYEKEVVKSLNNTFNETGISNLILEYYDIHAEYEYCSGQKTASDT